MARGYFIVSQYKQDAKDILFQPDPNAPPGPVPEDQLKLKSEVEQTLVVIKMLFENDDKTYFVFYHRSFLWRNVVLWVSMLKPR